MLLAAFAGADDEVARRGYNHPPALRGSSGEALDLYEYDVTLVTVTSIERIVLLEKMCERWHGPKVFVVFLPKDYPVFETQEWEERTAAACAGGGRMDVLKFLPEPTDSKGEFPVNRLRNEGILAVTTSHFFYDDIDFLPNPGAYEAVMRAVAANRDVFKDIRMGFVVPAFQLKGDCDGMRECITAYEQKIPSDKDSLRTMFIDREIHIFDEPYHGHSSTNYKLWFKQRPMTLRYVQCLDSNRYEPYLIVRKTQYLPLFDERFTGYGKNKIQWILHLRYLGWAFTVLPDVYVTHLPHPKSKARKHWEDANKPDNHRKRMDQMFKGFLDELQDLSHKKQKRVHLCDWVRDQKKLRLEEEAKQKERQKLRAQGLPIPEELQDPELYEDDEEGA
eukprot:CAMPEP_0118874748 /NCGR_PEP_ID=MMETSP1163-20130328/16075_1 /TAXON_ID=124430 /ORGANISM="Phaeomonas parva, Strain CCMP2877" /LENGTH=390 /DNA_ID=CAMNT_0006810171 /DNA_START=105 /DNA_END=1277 /DNA_ORIENTATION=+